MIWLHIIADLKQVNFSKLKIDKNILKQLITDKLKEVWLTELWNFYYTFSKENEITCVIALSESHINLHLWPEKSYISMDIFVCNFLKDNSNKAKKIYQDLIDFFRPWSIDKTFLKRKN
jgi:S-adenosylmethionine/arginine decarboxylase-like enzyme